MDVRIVGAGAAVAAGLFAALALVVVQLTPGVAPTGIPSDSLLIARSDVSNDRDASPLPNRLPARLPMSAIPPEASLAPSGPGLDPARSSPQAVPGQITPGQATPGQAPSPRVSPPPALDGSQSQRPSDPGAVLAQPPRPPRPPADHKYDNVLTMTEIGRFKAAMRLSPDQEPYWPTIASLLREVGRQQMAQVDAGQKPDFSMDMGMMQRFYSAASPLLQSLREDQKAELRKRAKLMGLGAYASYI